MPDIIGALERARTTELEVQTQVEHIEMLHRIARRARESSAYAAETVAKLEALERQLNSTIDEMVDAKRDALVYISSLTGEERSVIESYYILAKSWEQTALALYMSERRVFLLRKSALAKLKKRYCEPPRTAADAASHNVKGA
ncbi:MAG: hypothetical protein ACI4WS_01970 [Oscillospiraceae bacterium]